MLHTAAITLQSLDYCDPGDTSRVMNGHKGYANCILGKMWTNKKHPHTSTGTQTPAHAQTFKPENMLKIPIISKSIPWAQRGLCWAQSQRRMWDAEQTRDALHQAWASEHPHTGPPTRKGMGRSEVTSSLTTLVLLPNKEYHCARCVICSWMQRHVKIQPPGRWKTDFFPYAFSLFKEV